MAVGLIVSGYVDPISADRNPKVAIIGTTDSIPPCSKVEVHIDQIYAADRGENLLLRGASVVDYFLDFIDANAEGWERQKDGTILQKKKDSNGSAQQRYLSIMDDPDYDGPHQALVDQSLDAHKPIECGNRS
ncbi:hypothetical protein AB0G67_49125 [Streptomyces sp. NPDC021056]|uniref:hypothetical protein n=1 Tax=Streptomyces sp. NPDC021056 TaxID=3155012 RepID=UPI0033C1A77A